MVKYVPVKTPGQGSNARKQGAQPKFNNPTSFEHPPEAKHSVL